MKRKTPPKPNDGRGRHGKTPHGEKHPRAKLTDAQALAIKTASGKYAGIAALFGTSETNVSYIKSGKRWPWLKLPEQSDVHPVP